MAGPALKEEEAKLSSMKEKNEHKFILEFPSLEKQSRN